MASPDDDAASSASIPEAGRLVRGQPDGCQLCLYRWTSPNPVKRRAEKTPLLPRKAARSCYCGVCTANVYCNFESDTPTSIQEKVVDGTLTQLEYDDARKKYLAGVNGDGARCKRAIEDPGRQKVQTEKSKALRFARNCGVLWEVEMWGRGHQGS